MSDFKITKKHLTVYWDRDDKYGYYWEHARVNTPTGLSHFLRQIGSKGWGCEHPSIPALIRAMGRKFKWQRAEIAGLLNHGRFSYGPDNGKGGTRDVEPEWLRI